MVKVIRVTVDEGSSSSRLASFNSTPANDLTLAGHTGTVRGLSFSPVVGSGYLVSSGAGDCGVLLWDVAVGQRAPVLQLEGHQGAVFSIEMGFDGRTALSGGADNTVRLWDFRQRSCCAASSATFLLQPYRIPAAFLLRPLSLLLRSAPLRICCKSYAFIFAAFLLQPCQISDDFLLGSCCAPCRFCSVPATALPNSLCFPDDILPRPLSFFLRSCCSPADFMQRFPSVFAPSRFCCVPAQPCLIPAELMLRPPFLL